MLETTDTKRPFFTIPEGEHIVQILEVPVKKRTKSGDYFCYEFKFGYAWNGQKKTWTNTFMQWDLVPILKALQFKQVSEHSFEWDRELCKDRALKIKIVHEPDAKDSSKVWPKIKEAEELPF